MKRTKLHGRKENSIDVSLSLSGAELDPKGWGWGVLRAFHCIMRQPRLLLLKQLSCVFQAVQRSTTGALAFGGRPVLEGNLEDKQEKKKGHGVFGFLKKKKDKDHKEHHKESKKDKERATHV